MPPKKRKTPQAEAPAPDPEPAEREPIFPLPMRIGDVESIYRDHRVRGPSTEAQQRDALDKFNAIDWRHLHALSTYIAAGFHARVWDTYLSTEEGPDQVSQYRQLKSEFDAWQQQAGRLVAAAASIQGTDQLERLSLSDNEFIIEMVDTYERMKDVISKWKPVIEQSISGEQQRPDEIPSVNRDLQFLPITEEEVESARATVSARIEALLSEGVSGRLERRPLLEQVSQRSLQIELLQNALRLAVDRARAAGASWNEIGRAAGTTPQAAHRRWNEDARKWHRDYVRERYRPAAKDQPSAPSETEG